MGRVIAFFLISIYILIFQINSTQSLAQKSNSSGIAVYISIDDKNVPEGGIVSLSNSGYILSRTPYDPNIIGIVVKDPAVAFETHQPGDWPVVSEGKVYMRVTAQGGAIKKGDLLTTSTIPGVGQKANESGYIAGTALEEYNGKGGQTGKILVVLNIGHGRLSTDTAESVLTVLNKITTTPYLAPVEILRFLLAAIMVFASFLVAVNYFGRVSAKGIEALGRNPLAGRIIMFGIAMNVFLGVAIISVGIAVAYLILVL